MTSDLHPASRVPSVDDMKSVSPALADYTAKQVAGGLWLRPTLSRKDRYILTLAALVSTSQCVGMQYYFDNALEEGMTAAELSELVTHLAFYSGWSQAWTAVNVLREIFARRDIGLDQLPEIKPELLSKGVAVPDAAVISTFLDEHIGGVASGLKRYADVLLYGDVWRRPGLGLRERDLATISALVSSGAKELLPFYVVGALKRGMARDEISEIIVHLAFYAGWSNAVSAAGILKQLFETS